MKAPAPRGSTWHSTHHYLMQRSHGLLCKLAKSPICARGCYSTGHCWDTLTVFLFPGPLTSTSLRASRLFENRCCCHPQNYPEDFSSDQYTHPVTTHPLEINGNSLSGLSIVIQNWKRHLNCFFYWDPDNDTGPDRTGRY